MTLTDILHSVRQLSENDKLALIEATAQMLQQALGERSDESVAAVAEVAAPYQIEKVAVSNSTFEIDFDELSDTDLESVLRAHLYSPNPEPQQMLQRGLLRGMNFDEDDFRAAEWHPSQEDMAGV
jgi:hypothetical protein